MLVPQINGRDTVEEREGRSEIRAEVERYRAPRKVHHDKTGIVSVTDENRGAADERP
jgi:hypothetical protein